MQRYLPDIVATGDARVILVDGSPVPYALARIPSDGDNRGNLAAGARGVGRPLDDRDRWLCERIGPALRERGMLFVGLDVIGGYVTEINVTSPTGVRELDRQFGLDIAGSLMDAIAAARGTLTHGTRSASCERRDDHLMVAAVHRGAAPRRASVILGVRFTAPPQSDPLPSWTLRPAAGTGRARPGGEPRRQLHGQPQPGRRRDHDRPASGRRCRNRHRTFAASAATRPAKAPTSPEATRP